MRLGIVACDILKNEIEHLTKDDPDFVRREYLEFALHVYPEDMRIKIEDTVNSLKGEVDAVFVGYAVCSSLQGLTRNLEVPAVMLEGADCIDALLGSQEYTEEKRICTGTWFSSPGWAEQGIEGIIKELHLDSVEGYDPKFFVDMLFESYERCLFVDSGVGRTEHYMKKSEEVAEYLGLRHECRTCGLSKLEEAISKVKELGASLAS
ncbi:MAG: DUF1638 domain-containing protein [Candidatus Methanomethylophilaceae archaeon]|jgi:hypothetical protein